MISLLGIALGGGALAAAAQRRRRPTLADLLTAPGPSPASQGQAPVVYQGRSEDMDPWKAAFAQDTRARTLAEVIEGADIFLGLSASGVLKPERVQRMAEKPLILALANPAPEVLSEEVKTICQYQQ